MARKHSPLIPKELSRVQTSAAGVLLNQNLLMWQCGKLYQSHAVRQMTGKLNLFFFISQVLRCQGVDRGKRMYFKASNLCLVSTTEHTESEFREEHLAPCRFNSRTNLYSIGIRQPLAQLQCRYNVEIPRVSLPDDRLKWDFRTDRITYTAWKTKTNLKMCHRAVVLANQ